MHSPRIYALLQSLERAARDYAPAALASSLSAEDMVITDAILTEQLPIEIFAINTGRLHAETLSLVPRIARKYGYHVTVYRPDAAAVAAYESRNGRDAFYGSFELRRECCRVRKVEPLERALAGKRAWVTGLRETPGARERLTDDFHFDATFGVVKVNPLAHWTADEVWAYLRRRDVPYNQLYDQGYRSIGCAPCTRPTLAHEPERAGRWWWEHARPKECGLHPDSSGRVLRAREAA